MTDFILPIELLQILNREKLKKKRFEFPLGIMESKLCNTDFDFI